MKSISHHDRIVSITGYDGVVLGYVPKGQALISIPGFNFLKRTFFKF